MEGSRVPIEKDILVYSDWFRGYHTPFYLLSSIRSMDVEAAVTVADYISLIGEEFWNDWTKLLDPMVGAQLHSILF